jgi:hypothetical protein
MRGENGTEVPLANPGHACCPSKRYLLGADIYALRVEAVRLHQSDEVAAPAANVYDRASRGRRKQRMDVTSIDKSSRLAAAVADVLGRVGLVKTAAQVGQATYGHI